MDKLTDKVISVAEASERLENSDEPVEFAAWHRVAQIKCGKLKNIKNYDDLVKNIELEDIYFTSGKKKN